LYIIVNRKVNQTILKKMILRIDKEIMGIRSPLRLRTPSKPRRSVNQAAMLRPATRLRLSRRYESRQLRMMLMTTLIEMLAQEESR